jgi:hypothetical protein
MGSFCFERVSNEESTDADEEGSGGGVLEREACGA